MHLNFVLRPPSTAEVNMCNVALRNIVLKLGLAQMMSHHQAAVTIGYLCSKEQYVVKCRAKKSLGLCNTAHLY